jgi:hypothetical protein
VRVSSTTAGVFLSLAGSLGFLGCEDASWAVFISSGGFGPAGPVLFVSIEQGRTTGYRANDATFAGEELVIRDQVAWSELWRVHKPYSPVPPAVDFESDMVIAVFMGAIGTRCQDPSITLESLTREEGVLQAMVIEERGEGTCERATSPYHFVRCPRDAGEVRFTIDPPRRSQTLRPAPSAEAS